MRCASDSSRRTSNSLSLLSTHNLLLSTILTQNLSSLASKRSPYALGYRTTLPLTHYGTHLLEFGFKLGLTRNGLGLRDRGHGGYIIVIVFEVSLRNAERRMCEIDLHLLFPVISIYPYLTADSLNPPVALTSSILHIPFECTSYVALYATLPCN